MPTAREGIASRSPSPALYDGVMAERSHPRKRLRPGRIITRVIVFLLLGAIVNVAVAWGCSLWLCNDLLVSRTPDPVPSATATWPFYLQGAGWPKVDTVYDYGHCFGGDAVVLEGYTPKTLAPGDPRVSGVRCSIHRFGWPMRSMQWHGWSGGGPQGAALLMNADDLRGLLYAGIPVPSFVPARGGAAAHLFPTAPICPGFALNTAFYAVILWSVVCGPFALRRLIRRRRGRCIKCNYDLRGAAHDRCPECGVVV
jgi:hypothetical protein